jgi:Zn finger protein HypA/HybF involved in hydrogenase expression
MRVRIPSFHPTDGTRHKKTFLWFSFKNGFHHALVAKWIKAPEYESGDYEFESHRVYKNNGPLTYANRLQLPDLDSGFFSVRVRGGSLFQTFLRFLIYLKMRKTLNNEARRKIIISKNSLCEECGVGEEWNGKKLTLEVDHIDGNSQNNLNTNFRVLCPNCHSQTGTFSRRKYVSYKSIKIEDIENIIQLDWNLIDIFHGLKLNQRNPLCVNYIKNLLKNYSGSNIRIIRLKDKFIYGIVLEKTIKEKKIKYEYSRLSNDYLIKILIKNIEMSNISFTQHGWVKEVSKILLIKPQKVTSWMRREMPEFWNKKCFKRKGTIQVDAAIVQEHDVG